MSDRECRRELAEDQGWLICHRCGSLWPIHTMGKDWRPLSCVEVWGNQLAVDKEDARARAELAEATLEIAEGINAMRHELTDPGAQERRMERIADRMRDDKHKETLGTELSKTLDLASKLEAANAHIAKLEALVGDQKAATDEEFQNCSKIEAELASVRARNSELAGQCVDLEDDNAALKARIAELEKRPTEEDVARLMWQQQTTVSASVAEKEARIAELEEHCRIRDDDLERAVLFSNETSNLLIGARAEISELKVWGNQLAVDKEDARARAEKAEARSTELDEQNRRLFTLNSGFIDRAEKAEADCKRAEAERDALRDALTGFITEIGRVETVVRSISYNIADDLLKLINKARAALAPSPAGREG